MVRKQRKPRQNGFNSIHISCICFYLFLALLFCRLAGQSFGEVALSALHVFSSFLISIGVMDKHRSEVAKTSRDTCAFSQIQSHSHFSCKARFCYILYPDSRHLFALIWSRDVSKSESSRKHNFSRVESCCGRLYCSPRAATVRVLHSRGTSNFESHSKQILFWETL